MTSPQLEVFTITSLPYTFKATIHLSIDGDDKMYRIRVGGKKQCIYISLTAHEEYADLMAVKHDAECILSCLDEGDGAGHALPRSAGTVKLVCVALSFVLLKCPWIKGFIFLDHSKLHCVHDVKLPLADYYIAKHGKTWYHSKFGALPLLETHKQAYITAIARYEHMRIGATTPKAFYDTYVRPVEKYIRIRGKSGFLAYLQTYFEEHMPKHDTYSGFLREMTSDEEGLDCTLFQKWLPEFIRSVIPIPLMEIDWIIDCDIVKGWKVKLKVTAVDVQSEGADGAAAVTGTYWGGQSQTQTGRATPW